VVSHATAKFEDEAGLPNPGVPGNEHHLTLSGLRLLESLFQEAELAVAADVRRQPSLRLHVEATPRHLSADHFPGPRRLRLALEGEWSKRPRVKVAGYQSVYMLGDENPPWIGGLLQPGGHISRVSDRRVVHPEVAPDAPHDNEPRVQALANLEAETPLALELLPIPLQHRPEAEAAWTARWAWSSWAIGAPKRAMIPSPRNWFTVPS
jgi:hypothetical protein